MTTISLPWPSSRLSPNARGHWRRKSTAAKAYRWACYIETKRQRAKLPEGARFNVLMEFTPPDRRRYDLDNLIARCKNGLDGIADALGIDDRRFAFIGGEFAPANGIGIGCVRVRITAHVSSELPAAAKAGAS